MPVGCMIKVCYENELAAVEDNQNPIKYLGVTHSKMNLGVLLRVLRTNTPTHCVSPNIVTLGAN